MYLRGQREREEGEKETDERLKVERGKEGGWEIQHTVDRLRY